MAHISLVSDKFFYSSSFLFFVTFGHFGVPKKALGSRSYKHKSGSMLGYICNILFHPPTSPEANHILLLPMHNDTSNGATAQKIKTNEYPKRYCDSNKTITGTTTPKVSLDFKIFFPFPDFVPKFWIGCPKKKQVMCGYIR